MKRLCFLAVLILVPMAFILPRPMPATARGMSTSSAMRSIIGVSSAVTPGPGQGRWLMLNWYAYSTGSLKLYPTDTGSYAGWTLPGYDDSAWDDYTHVVWDRWWGASFAQPSIPELGQHAAIGRKGFVNRATYLYRRSFDIPPSPEGYTLRNVELRAWSDNNAVFYINGQLVFISCFPAGTSASFTPRQLGLSARNNVLALQLSNDDQSYNPIGVQYLLIFNYEAVPSLCFTGLSPSSPRPEGTALTVSARAEDSRGIYLVRFLINSATDGSSSGTWWRFGEVAGGGQTVVNATATLDWSAAPADFPRTGTHLIGVNSFYAEGQFSARWLEDPCRQQTYTWYALLPESPTPTFTLEPPGPTDTPTPTFTSEPPGPTDTPTPTFTPEPPGPTDTPTPTFTSEPPGPTDTPTPTETPSPTAAPSATASPIPSPVKLARLELQMWDWHDPLTYTSQRQRYTIVITNTGQVPVTGVVLTDTVPSGVDVLLAESSPGATYDGDRQVSWPLGTLAPGESAVRYMEIRTHSWHRHCTYIVNRVAADSAETDIYSAESYTLIRYPTGPTCALPILP